VSILVGAQSLSLLLNLDMSNFWIWDVTVFKSKDTAHLLKWVAMGTLFWLWYVLVVWGWSQAMLIDLSKFSRGESDYGHPFDQLRRSATS
jgi:hypothetical protein